MGAKKKGFRFWTKSMFNVSRWLGWQDLRSNASNIHQLYQMLFTIPTRPVFRETFEQAIERMGLDEAHLAEVKLAYFRRANLFLALLVLGLVYHVYLLFHQQWMASFVMISIDFMLFAFWFREHFWYTQMRVRRLGLTFKEWLVLCCSRDS